MAFDGCAERRDALQQHRAELAGGDAPGRKGAAVMQRSDLEVNRVSGVASPEEI
jgi:hypothetical protein